MKKFMAIVSLILLPLIAIADTPPPNTIKAKVADGSGTGITSTASGGKQGLDVNIINAGGSSTVNQGTPNGGGANAWPVTGTLVVTQSVGSLLHMNIDNFPATFGVTQSGSWTVAVNNFPSSYPVTGTFFQATQPVSGTLTAVQPTGTNLHVVVDNTIPVSIPTPLPVTIPTPVPVTGTFFQATQPVSAVALPLPANAAQETGGHLASVDTKLSTINTTLGSPMQNTGGTTTVIQPTGSNLHVAVDSAPSTAVTGTVTAVQPTGSNLHVNVDSAPTTTVTGTVTANAGTNLNTSALALESGGHLASIDTKTPALGQALSAASVPVVLPAAQITTLTPLTTVTVIQPTGTNLHEVVDSGTITANIGTTNGLALDTSVQSFLGSASGGTAATKSGLFGGIYNTSLPTLTPGQQSSIQLDSNARIIIRPLTAADVVSSAQSGTWTVQQGGAPWSQNITQVGGASLALGQAAAASSIPVVTQANNAPATANVTIQDTASTTTAMANAQNYITGTPTTNSAASFTVASFESLEVLVTGTWTGTLSSEISMDGGTTWFTRGVKQSGASYIASTFTNNFSGGLNISGMTNYRVRATAAMTGTATVKVVQTLAPSSLTVTNPITIRDTTTQSVTTTVKAASTAAAAADTALVVAISPNNYIQASFGRAEVKTFTQSYSSSNLATGAFTTIITSTASNINLVDIFDTSGSDYYIAYAATCGALSNATNAIIVSAGGGGKGFYIPSGNCVGFEAKTAAISAGSVNMTFYN